MEWWSTLLLTAGTCLVTLIVTFVFNYVVDGPKRKKQKEDELNKRLQKTLDDSVGKVNNGLEHVLQIYEKSRQDSIRERQKLYDTIDKINKNIDDRMNRLEDLVNKQSNGLQMILRVELKKDYTYWLSLGYAPVGVRDELEKIYQAYHGLGGNSIISELRERFLKLPLDKQN